MKIKATTPCYKFRYATAKQQCDKMAEELKEVAEALKNFENADDMLKPMYLKKLFEEILDVQVCASTFIYQLVENYDCAALLEEAKEYVVMKNMARGYYVPADYVDKFNNNSQEPF